MTCPANTDCECFTLAVPASNPVVGSQAGGYATPVPTPVAYGVGAVANDLHAFDAADRSDQSDSGDRRHGGARAEPDA